MKKIELKLERRNLQEGYTEGVLFVDGEYFCDTLEDKVRDLPEEKKVMHETAIPAGTYKVIVNQSPKFKRELPRLLDAPFFEGILIHRGNYPKDTSGCILVGEKRGKDGVIINSTPYELKLTQLLKTADEVEIEVINNQLKP